MSEKLAPDDSQLIEAARAGDERAFETLYRRYRDFVLIIAVRFGATGQDALDVLQETFLYLLRKLPGLELQCRLRTLLYPVAKHLALDRKAARRGHADLDAVPDPPARPGEESTAVDSLEAVLHLLARLPPGEAEVVWLRFVDGLSLDEVAAALAIPLGTVKSRLHAALEALRRRPAAP